MKPPKTLEQVQAEPIEIKKPLNSRNIDLIIELLMCGLERDEETARDIRKSCLTREGNAVISRHPRRRA